MNKLKINAGLVSVIILASLFAGWQTLLLVVLFILLFCEINDTIKGMIVKVVSFCLALTLFTTVWGIICDAVPLITNAFTNFIKIIEGYADEMIDISNINNYLFNPLNSLVDIADSIVTYVLVIVKFIFALSILTNKAMKDNFMVRFINKFVDKIINFINGVEIGKIDVNHPEVASAPRPEMISSNNNVVGAMPRVSEPHNMGGGQNIPRGDFGPRPNNMNEHNENK